MRIATVHLLLDVDSDSEACDFCSETFGDMPYVVDWAHVKPARAILSDESTAQYIQLGDYEEGDFLRSAKSFIRRELVRDAARRDRGHKRSGASRRRSNRLARREPMSDETYNGWKNYPTWAVNLWLSNDRGLYEETLVRTQATIESPPHTSEYWNEEETSRFNVADMLKDFIEELAGEAYSEASFVADLLGYALGQVDWNEIADAWIESVKEQVSA